MLKMCLDWHFKYFDSWMVVGYARDIVYKCSFIYILNPRWTVEWIAAFPNMKGTFPLV